MGYKYLHQIFSSWANHHYIVSFHLFVWDDLAEFGRVSNTVRFHYNAVQYNRIFHTALHLLKQNMNQSLNEQKAPHTSAWRVSYGVSIVRILEKIDRIITTLPCIGLSHLPLMPHICVSNAAYMRQWIGSAMVQIMACHLFGAKPLSYPMLEYWQLNSWEQTSVKSQSKFIHFHWGKYIRKYLLWNGGHFVPGKMSWLIVA